MICLITNGKEVIFLNLENLRENYHALLLRLETDGYSAAYIARVRGMVTTILGESSAHGWKDYYDIQRYCEIKYETHDTLVKKLTVLGAIMEFDLNGKFPDRTTPTLAKSRRGSYYKLSPEFKTVIDHFKVTERERGKKESSILVESSNASSFLLRIQDAGAYRLSDITEEIVVPMFAPSDGGGCMTFTHRKCITNAIRTYSPKDPHNCQKVLAVIPSIKKAKKNVQYLKELEKQAVLSALGDMSNNLSLRDRAIGTLAYYTGMRTSDIADLDLSSLDWDRDIIFINQRKTGVALCIPMAVSVGNAIYDYIVNERPKAECSALFLAGNMPHRRLLDMWHVSDSILSAAGIRQSEGERKGLHIFRHNVATSLMGKGIQRAVISDALGHAAPESLEPYLSANIIDLKECALSIEHFPVNEGVFADA